MKKFCLSVLLLMMALCGAAKKQKSGPARLQRPVVVAAFDTIVPPEEQIRCSGYDKPNQATRETFFITNAGDFDVVAVNLTLKYFDTKGRQLHSATHTVRTDIPAGETRSVSVSSWDRNNAFHYYRSPAPMRRASSPYSVKATINYVLR